MRLLALFAACLGACAFQRRGIDPKADDLYFPTGVRVHASGRYAYVTNSNFDLRYNAGTLVTIDLDAIRLGDSADDPYNQRAIISARTQRIGNIGATPVLNGSQSKIYVATRERALLFHFDVDADGAGVGCGEGKPFEPQMSCDEAHVERLDGRLFSPDLAFADTADPYVGAIGKPYIGLESEFLYLTHLSSGAVTVYDVTPNAVDNARGFKPVALLGADTLGISVNGTSAIAVTNAPGRKSFVYAGASGNSTTQRRLSSALFYFEPRVAAGEPGTVGSIPLYQLLGGGLASVDVKDIGISPDANRLYMVTRDPEALVAMDISLGVDGTPKNALIRAVPLDRQPGQLTYLRGSERDVIYVSCFQDNTLRAYDAGTLSPLSKISDLKAGPYALDVAYRGAQTWLLATYFQDDALLVIDATSPDTSEHTVVARVGTPRSDK